jgi:hypothetical protein
MNFKLFISNVSYFDYLRENIPDIYKSMDIQEKFFNVQPKKN